MAVVPVLGNFVLFLFPTGSVEDYYSPNCKELDDMDDVVKGCYWAGVVPC